MLFLKLAVNSVINPTKKINLTDDNYFDINNIFSTTNNNGNKNVFSQNIHSNNFKLFHAKNNTSSYSG